MVRGYKELQVCCNSQVNLLYNLDFFSSRVSREMVFKGLKTFCYKMNKFQDLIYPMGSDGHVNKFNCGSHYTTT
jgi:hypothetical protein